jgi:hypothetical protein
VDHQAVWAEQRRIAADIQQERLRQRQSAEHSQAEQLLAEFLPVVTEHGPDPVALEVQGYGGHGRARTKLRGWYLRNNRTVALGTDGYFYVLIAPLSLVDRVRGVVPRPTRPPIVIGEGGKDGDSIALTDALERVLPNWREYQTVY